jgi:hypothetical protein
MQDHFIRRRRSNRLVRKIFVGERLVSMWPCVAYIKHTEAIAVRTNFIAPLFRSFTNAKLNHRVSINHHMTNF